MAIYVLATYVDTGFWSLRKNRKTRMDGDEK